MMRCKGIFWAESLEQLQNWVWHFKLRFTRVHRCGLPTLSTWMEMTTFQFVVDSEKTIV